MSFKTNLNGEIIIDQATFSAINRLIGMAYASGYYTEADEPQHTQDYLQRLRTYAETLDKLMTTPPNP